MVVIYFLEEWSRSERGSHTHLHHCRSVEFTAIVFQLRVVGGVAGSSVVVAGIVRRDEMPTVGRASLVLLEGDKGSTIVVDGVIKK